jgi:hypothetical protein
MTLVVLWRQALDPVRTHWRLSGVAFGFPAIVVGRLLVELNQSFGMPLIYIGTSLALCDGGNALRQFLGANPLRPGTWNVVGVAMLLSVIATQPAGTAVKTLWGTAQPRDYWITAILLAAICVLALLLRPFEPSDLVLRRLHGRIRRAALSRTVANCAGISAVAALLAARFGETYPAPLISATLTLLVAMAVVTHKIYARTRKLCTKVHTHIDTLLRDMEALHSAPDPAEGSGKLTDKQMAARRSWDALKRDLRTTIDSGYRPLAMPFLPASTITDLEIKVLTAIDSADFLKAAPAYDDLRVILTACSARIDELA